MSDMFRENVGERIGEKLNENYLSCLYRVENIRDRLQELIGIDGEVVMSSNIYQNLIPILGGYEAEAYDMKGYIIKSLNGKYYFYEVSFKTLEITAAVHEITSSEAIDIFNKNERNKDVYGLREFFGVNRGLV